MGDIEDHAESGAIGCELVFSLGAPRMTGLRHDPRGSACQADLLCMHGRKGTAG
jgi:hypothetical protein